MRCKIGADQSSPVTGHTKIFAQQSLSGARSETNQNLRLHYLQLSVEPRAARFNLRMARLLVDATFTALRSLPLEVLDDVGHVHFRAVDSDFDQNFVEQPACGSNKWMAGAVFIVAWLLAYEHHARFGWSFPEDGLGPEFPKIAGLAGLRSPLEIFQGQDLRNGGSRLGFGSTRHKRRCRPDSRGLFLLRGIAFHGNACWLREQSPTVASESSIDDPDVVGVS